MSAVAYVCGSQGGWLQLRVEREGRPADQGLRGQRDYRQFQIWVGLLRRGQYQQQQLQLFAVCAGTGQRGQK